MFLITTLVDTIRIPPHMLALPTLKALQCEIDLKYPNRVVMDVGLVISRYGPVAKQITNGSCVPGDGGSHHECLFQLMVFRPFVEEVCLGKIVKSTSEGIQVTLGFFQDIFIPAYWMLRPSKYEESTGLWIWTPNYDDEEDDDDENGGGDGGEKEQDGNNNKNSDGTSTKDERTEEKNNDSNNKNDEKPAAAAAASVKLENNNDVQQQQQPGGGEQEQSKGGNDNDNNNNNKNEENDDEEEENRFEMEIGAEIRFKVKSIHFTQVTTTAKGVQATTITTAHSLLFPPRTSSSSSNQNNNNNNGNNKDGSSSSMPPDAVDSSTLDKPLRVRKRSTSVDLTENRHMPASMHIIASICEDGLGLTSWWTSAEEEAEDEDDDEEEENDDEHVNDEDQGSDGYDEQGGYGEEVY